ncbi:MAG TPA: SusC/RagA family TonB-linked outer membrane protein, partial [Gemmatimonadales bacterium]|nr:SusC/RagA family TonB-linked outer membrane protein [Gemmatimonadales bacterium]
MRVGIRLGIVGVSVVLGSLLVSTRSAEAQQGAIGGQVVDEAAGTPLEAARVLLTGTGQIATTNREGRFLFRQVAPGTHQVRVLRVGYKPATQSTTVAAGETAALSFSLAPAVVQLDELVTTATGLQRKLEVANATSTIDAARIAEEAPITEFTNLISGRAAGVQVLKSGGTTGTGTRIRIRGSNSISLSNEPLYYVDGIRLEAASSSSTLDIGGFGAGDSRTSGPSRLNDLNPDDIESIEIVKGPAAATLYGIQASNGVVRITTKKGSSGAPKWNFFVEQGAVQDHNHYLLNFFGRDSTVATGPDYDYFCLLQAQLDGLCTQTSVQQYSPLENPSTRPLKAGLRQQYGANVSGGNDLATYFLSAQYESEDGVFRLPRIEEDSIRSALGSVPSNQIRPNALDRTSVRANLTTNLSKKSDLSASLGYVSSDSRFVENDNSALTITGSAETSTNPDTLMSGWYYTPAQLFAELATQAVERFTGGLTYNFRPQSWLTTRATVGYDIVNRRDIQFFPTGQVAPLDQNNDGVRSDNKFQISQTSVDLGATARYGLSSSMAGKTSVGGQFFRDLSSGNLVTGRGLVPGSQTITGAGSIEARDTTVESRSIGTFVEQEISLRERLFVTGALRFDDNSAFGQNFDATVYPKVSASWLLSDEPFFHAGFINTLRLRGAYGVAGQQPGTTDALRFFTPVAAKKAGVGGFGVTFGSLGNANLKPERSREFELGFDAGLLNDRVSVEFTYYNKLTKDALLLRPISPSLGVAESQFFNLGRVRNFGAELAIDTRLIDRKNFVWDLVLSGSLNRNRIIELGPGVDPFYVPGSFYQRQVPGYAAGGFWGQKVTFDDANGDGLISAGDGLTIPPEYAVDTALSFLGNALPTREASLNTSITLFNNRVRIGSQFDYRGGHIIDNSIENYRCYVGNCRGLVDPTAPLREQALAQAAFGGFSSAVVFDEPGWFIKMRELSLTLFAPDGWARAMRASRVSLTLAGRNLWTVTDYSGVDPEVNAFGQDNFS